MTKQWMLKPAAAIAATLFGTALSGAASAQSATSWPQAAPAAAATPAATPAATAAARQVRMSQLIGKEVRNAQGENLGGIKDVIVDVSNGRVHYVVLSFGGFLGLGDKLFAYPVRAFRHAPDKDELVLNVDRERLKAAPGFEAGNYPDFTSGDYRTSVDRYFGPQMSTTVASTARMVRASELMGKDVNDPAGKDLGEIQDVVVNMNNGDVRYAVLEFDQSWSLRDKLFAFPLKSFRIGTRWSDDLVLDVSKDKLNNTPGFDKSAWPRTDLNDPKIVADIDRYVVATAIVPLPPAANDALFGRLDANKDGWLSAAEAKAEAKVESNWGKLDADSNQRVTRAEFDAAYRP